MHAQEVKEVDEREAEKEVPMGVTGEALHEIAYPDCVHATAGIRSIYYLLEFSRTRACGR